MLRAWWSWSIDALQGTTGTPRRPGATAWCRGCANMLPRDLQNAIARSVPVAVRDAVVNRSIVDGRDWSRTPGFALLADANAYLRFNLAGRELAGMLEPRSDAQARYRDLLLRCLRSFRLDSGQPLVEEVLFAETHFSGRRSQLLPDIIVTWPEAGPASEIHSDEFGTIRADLATGRGGNHRPNGFCIELCPGRQRPGAADAISIRELGVDSLAGAVTMNTSGSRLPAVVTCRM